MMKAVFSSLLVAIVAVNASAVPITITLTAAPSSDPVAAAAGQYLPNETVVVSSSLSAPNDLLQIGLIQWDYSLSGGAGSVNLNSETCTSALCNALALEVNPPNNPIYAKITAGIPSTATILAGGSAFASFTVTTGANPGDTLNVSVLGPNTPSDADGAFITTDDFSVIWDNGAPGSEQILGGTASLTVVPEPASLGLLVLGAVAALRRRAA